MFYDRYKESIFCCLRLLPLETDWRNQIGFVLVRLKKKKIMDTAHTTMFVNIINADEVTDVSLYNV